MGKGDIRTRRGKLFRGSFGNTRPKHNPPKSSGRAAKGAPPAREGSQRKRT